MGARLEPTQIEQLLQHTRVRLLKDDTLDDGVRQLAGEYIGHLEQRGGARATENATFAAAVGISAVLPQEMGQLMFKAGHIMRQTHGDPLDVLRPYEGDDPLVHAAQVVGRLAVDGRSAAEVHLAAVYNKLHGSIK